MCQGSHQVFEGLPKETIVCPGHDYKGRNQTSIGDEFRTNPRVAMPESAFISFMDAYHPAKPELFDQAIQENSR